VLDQEWGRARGSGETLFPARDTVEPDAKDGTQTGRQLAVSCRMRHFGCSGAAGYWRRTSILVRDLLGILCPISVWRLCTRKSWGRL
jgi:hypothetical protein